MIKTINHDRVKPHSLTYELITYRIVKVVCEVNEPPLSNAELTTT